MESNEHLRTRLLSLIPEGTEQLDALAKTLGTERLQTDDVNLKYIEQLKKLYQTATGLLVAGVLLPRLTQVNVWTIRTRLDKVKQSIEWLIYVLEEEAFETPDSPSPASRTAVGADGHAQESIEVAAGKKTFEDNAHR